MIAVTHHHLPLQGMLAMNCYIISYGKDCYIIDPGFQKEKIINYVKQHDFNVLGILLTHTHFDHVGALDCYTVPIYMHENEYVVFSNASLSLADWGDTPPYDVADLKLNFFKDGDSFPIGDKYVQAIYTPGHTQGCSCFRFENELYSGDTLFAGAVGRWDLPTGDLNALRKSVVKLIESQDPQVRVHPAHGPSSTIAREKSNNPYYLDWC